MQRVLQSQQQLGAEWGEKKARLLNPAALSAMVLLQTALLADRAAPSCRYQSRALFFSDTYENLPELSSHASN